LLDFLCRTAALPIEIIVRKEKAAVQWQAGIGLATASAGPLMWDIHA